MSPRIFGSDKVPTAETSIPQVEKGLGLQFKIKKAAHNIE
jgi:hypothetical protein